jgi:hypothetical protein
MSTAKHVEAKIGEYGGPKFDPGRIVMTPGSIEALANNNMLVSVFLVHHICGKWGKLDSHGARANESALKTGLRILSNYELPNGENLYIITEAVDIAAGENSLKRQLTTVLLPSEY